jgi:hypothetical protein
MQLISFSSRLSMTWQVFQEAAIWAPLLSRRSLLRRSLLAGSCPLPTAAAAASL